MTKQSTIKPLAPRGAEGRDDADIVVAALYRFAPFPEYAAYQVPLSDLAISEGVCGTLLLAEEGVNGTIAGSRRGIDKLVGFLRGLPGFAELEVKESYAHAMPFPRMKVRLKREIVTMGEPGIDPLQSVGTYVAPTEWNDLISGEDVIVVDTRNDYEVEIGTFEGALDPKTKSFREFPSWARKNLEPGSKTKVAMFCTGGIRCEKATALLKELGHEHVYHLKGGILKYLEQVPEDESLWHGECFVFDQRVSVGHGLKPGPFKLCSMCRQPFLEEPSDHVEQERSVAGGGYSHGFCATCEAEGDPDRRARATSRQKQIELAKSRGEKHLGQQRKS